MKGIALSLINLAIDEGDDIALDSAQKLQISLEVIAESGNEQERHHALTLLRLVNRAIEVLLERKVTLIGRTFGTDSNEFKEEVLQRLALTD